MRKLTAIWTLLVLLVSTAQGQSWLNPWQGRSTIAINNGFRTISDYQVPIRVEYDDCMSPDFSDLRFVNISDNSLYDYWIEYVDTAQFAYVHVKLPVMQGYTTQNIYMYYGNPNAVSLSDPYATWVYFDDMDDDSNLQQTANQNARMVTLPDGTTVLEKYEYCNGEYAWIPLPSTLTDFKLITREFRPDTSVFSDNNCNAHVYGLTNNNLNEYFVARDGGNQIGYLNTVQSFFGFFNYNNNNVANQPPGEWYRTELSKSRNCSFFQNLLVGSLSLGLTDSEINALSYNSSADFDNVNVNRFLMAGGKEYFVDYIAIGRSTCIRPTVSFINDERCAKAEVVTTTQDYCLENAGSISFEVSGGIPPYDVVWFLNSDTLGMATLATQDIITISNLAPGTYQIKVSDSQGCGSL